MRWNKQTNETHFKTDTEKSKIQKQTDRQMKHIKTDIQESKKHKYTYRQMRHINKWIYRQVKQINIQIDIWNTFKNR